MRNSERYRGGARGGSQRMRFAPVDRIEAAPAVAFATGLVATLFAGKG